MTDLERYEPDFLDDLTKEELDQAGGEIGRRGLARNSSRTAATWTLRFRQGEDLGVQQKVQQQGESARD